MGVLADCIEDIYAAPRGPCTGAFFDYDGTVIDGYSAGAFYRRRIRNRELGLHELFHTLLAGIRGIETAEEFENFLGLTLQSWTGASVEQLMELGEELFVSEIAGKLHPEVWQLIEAHRECGHHITLASSATRFQVEPMARELDFDEIICTELEADDGLLTGRLAGPPRWGTGKARAAVEIAKRRKMSLRNSFAYSNGAEDVRLLDAVGHAVAVQPSDALRVEADQRGWRILEVESHGGLLPSPINMARTAALYGSMIGAFGVALGVGAVRRSRRQVLDLTYSLGPDVGLSAAGIDLNVTGVENLWSSRPAVFIFNHQSKLDVLIMMKLLRERFTGVVKKEAADIPGWGHFFRFADVAFVDRGNSEAAQQALAPAVKALREQGISLALSPEGTRSPTPRLRPFKKGAFHIAMQAGVPIVPVVLRNAGQVMSRSAQTVRGGTVDVCVLPPIDPTGWDVSQLGRHIEAVRDQYLETLVHWPNTENPTTQRRGK